MSLSGYNQMTDGLATNIVPNNYASPTSEDITPHIIIIIINIISLPKKKTDKKKTHMSSPSFYQLSSSGMFLLLLLSVFFVSVSHLINFFPDGDILYWNLEVFCIRVSSSSFVWQIVLVRHRLLYSLTYYVKVS